MTLCHDGIQIKLSPKTTIQEYIQLVSSADLIIGVDSGTIHLAIALKKKFLAFYARNIANFCRWQPRGNANISYKTIMSKIESDSNNYTHDFPMKEAANWINELFQTHPTQ